MCRAVLYVHYSGMYKYAVLYSKIGYKIVLGTIQPKQQGLLIEHRKGSQKV